MKKLNSTEIAKLAGVSRSTVSRVVNGYANVPAETREKVMKVINENEYYPLLCGQLLAGKNTGTLGFFWISNAPIASDFLSSTFFIHVIESAAAYNYLILTSILKNLTDEENINWVKRIFFQERIDAGIFVGTNNNEPLIDELIARGKIVSLFDYYHPEITAPNLITANFETDTGGKVIDYLCGLGHKKIAVIDGNMNHYSSLKRHESYIAAMQRHKLEIRGEWMRYADIVESSGYSACKEMIAQCKKLPTAICANNDSAAFGVYTALEEANISIPDKISVIGIDGHPRSKFQKPPLTTFTFDFNQLFGSLVGRTIAAVEKQNDIISNEFFPGSLVERCSCSRIV
ncbi:MAG: LacI family transcriptional regulator [Clostridiales bacterium]|jgi:LacI family transcriptional regulator|nr:LacI family transcriptional regulator [Clostridiales bacterium]